MKRRKFIGVLLALPMFGSFVARAFGDEAPPPGHLGTVDEDDVAHTVWGYLDHASSWEETVARLRQYVADGNGDGAVFTEIADAIEAALQADPEEEPAGVLGLYPAVVLMLDALRATRVHGAEIDDQRQRAFVVRLIEAA